MVLKAGSQTRGRSPGATEVGKPWLREYARMCPENGSGLNISARVGVIWQMGAESVRVEPIEAVYRRRGADFFRLALARTSDPELARDAVQEGFARAIRGRAGFRGSGSLEAWICRCVLNAASDARRPAAEQALSEGDSVAWNAEMPDAEVRAAVRRLPARQRDALFLRFYLDFDYLTIAETLGIEVGTVSATLHAARTNLMQALEEAPR